MTPEQIKALEARHMSDWTAEEMEAYKLATGQDYICAMCGGTFEKSRSDEEALAEMKENFGDVPATEPLDIVCDDCFQKIDPKTHPAELAGWKAEREISYDPKCGDLARNFLMDYAMADADYREAEKALAGVIQLTIEEWLEERFAPHTHPCQQCDKVVTEDCTCTRGQYMTWCSSNCRAAYDL
jgi:hypothetical protein